MKALLLLAALTMSKEECRATALLDYEACKVDCILETGPDKVDCESTCYRDFLREQEVCKKEGT